MSPPRFESDGESTTERRDNSPSAEARSSSEVSSSSSRASETETRRSGGEARVGGGGGMIVPVLVLVLAMGVSKVGRVERTSGGGGVDLITEGRVPRRTSIDFSSTVSPVKAV
jgi:hypothetical protein